MRMLPGQRPRPLLRELRRVVDDKRVGITPIVTGDATVKETLDAFDRRAAQAPSTTDTPWRRRGIPVYGIYPYPITLSDLQAMHGNDERISIRSLEQGTDMLTRVLRREVGARAGALTRSR